MDFFKKYISLTFFIVVTITFSFGQQKKTAEQYIEEFKDVAMTEMVNNKIPASITLAQGLFESGNGNSKLAREAKNHFGIKCHKNWTGKTMYQDDDEENECFRAYESAAESYRDHSSFLVNSQRYASLFELKITDYKGWARGLKAAGYATFPKYADVLISLIEKYNLTQYDQLVVKGKFKPGKTEKSTPTKKSEKPVVKDKNYLGPPTTFEKAGLAPDGRQIYLNNHRKFIYAKAGETTYQLAEMFGIYYYQIPKYNDLGYRTKLNEGEMIYIERKRNRADKNRPYHIVVEGDNLIKISRQYGVALKAIYRRNNLNYNSVISPGDIIKLR